MERQGNMNNVNYVVIDRLLFIKQEVKAYFCIIIAKRKNYLQLTAH
jgi:hypothetical protein